MKVLLVGAGSVGGDVAMTQRVLDARRMIGRVIVGTHVSGLKDGKPRETFSYQMCDAQDTVHRHGLQPVAWQAGINPVVAMELLAHGTWQDAGVLLAESFDPDPYVAVLQRDGIDHATIDI